MGVPFHRREVRVYQHPLLNPPAVPPVGGLFFSPLPFFGPEKNTLLKAKIVRLTVCAEEVVLGSFNDLKTDVRRKLSKNIVSKR